MKSFNGYAILSSVNTNPILFSLLILISLSQIDTSLTCGTSMCSKNIFINAGTTQLLPSCHEIQRKVNDSQTVTSTSGPLAASQRISFHRIVKNCNHKRLGIYYLLSAFIFGISGTLISVLIRIELYSSGNRIISPENQNFYNISITLHGFLMIFFLVMPGLFGGFGNYFVVIFQGSPEVVYPRVNNFSILILSLSYLFLILSLISEFGGGTGWTLYPPLSTSFMSLSPSSTAYLIFGLLMSGISSCLTSLNFWTTILNLRSYYLTLKTMPLFPWALLITGGMLLLTLPILSGALLMVLADLHSNTLFFDPIFGGDPIFYQHLFWFLVLLLIRC